MMFLRFIAIYCHLCMHTRIYKKAVTNMVIDNIRKQHTQNVLFGVNKALQMTSKRDLVAKRAKML